MSIQQDLEQPDIVGKYRIGSKIGEGSFAKVYDAYHLETNANYAIKVITFDKLGSDAKLQQNIISEVSIMSNYKHPSICHLFESFQSTSRIYLVLERCMGGDLQSFIRDNNRLDEFSCVRIFLPQLASGLSFLHSHGIIHRDIKSQNILLTEKSVNAQLKITDFGFAKHLEGLLLTKSICGTPLYMV